MTADKQKLEAFLGKMVGDLGAAASGALVIIGDRLGLYRSLAANGPMNSEELAKDTNTSPRYIQEWLACQAASGFIEFDPQNEKFLMSAEQKAVFADENSPFLMTGGFYSIASVYHDEKKISEIFRSGKGMSWGDHHDCLFCGTAKFFRPSYKAHLISEWIPALDGIEEKLKAGIRVADVGCGYGHSTMIMAETYPKSEFVGFDIHQPSVRQANELAKRTGLKNLRFETASAQDFPGKDYGFIAFFDCLHDMGDPAGAISHARQALADSGKCMIVEPFAHDDLAENLNPVGRVYYAFSATVCTPNALSQPGGMALGTMAGEKRISEVVKSGGMKSFRRAAETPFNLIFEAGK